MKKKWFNNGTEEILIESNSAPEGFKSGRLKKVYLLAKTFPKELIFQKYIAENIPFHLLCEQLNLSRKDLRSLLSYYEIRKSYKDSRKNNKYQRTHEKSIEIGKKSSITQKKSWNKKSKDEMIEWSEKCKYVQLNMTNEKKEQKIQKYLSYWNSLSQKEKNVINQKRSNSCKKTFEDNGQQILDNMKKTEKENRLNRLCRTVSEQKMFDVLIKIFDDVKYDERIDDRYTYFVDFYIPDEDLFIELNAHPSHGRLPIDKMDIDEYSKYPEKWYDTYGRRDVEKLNKASENKLNYIRIYPQGSLQDNLDININNDAILVETLYNSQK